MGDSQAWEKFRKERGQPPIPDDDELFEYGTPAARKAALDRIRDLALSPPSDVALRRKLAEAKRLHDDHSILPKHIKAIGLLEKRTAEALRALDTVSQHFHPPVPEIDQARDWLRRRTVGRLPKRGRGERYDGYKRGAIGNVVSLRLRDKDGTSFQLDRDDARVFLAAIGVRFQGRPAQ